MAQVKIEMTEVMHCELSYENGACLTKVNACARHKSCNCTIGQLEVVVNEVPLPTTSLPSSDDEACSFAESSSSSELDLSIAA